MPDSNLRLPTNRMKLILITNERVHDATVALLEDAAKKLDVNVLRYHYADPIPDLDPSQKYLLYKVTAASGSMGAARALCDRYVCVSAARYRHGNAGESARDLAGIPAPVTVAVDSLEEASLLEKVAEIGGFPVVIKDKIPGGHGAGVVKVENIEALQSISRMILDFGRNARFKIQEFLPHSDHARLIVLGNEVIDSIVYHSNDYDFRTNRSDAEIDVEPMKFPAEVEQTAIRATHANSLELGGVDIIIDGDDHRVLEVNNPLNFARAQNVTGVPTDEKIIAYLLAKADYRPKNRWPKKRPRPTLALINMPGRRVVRDALIKQAKCMNLPVIEVPPAAAKTGLRQNGTYLLYRICTGHRAREIERHNKFDCTSFAGTYPAFTEGGYDRNRHYRDAGLPFVPKVPIRRKAIGYVETQLAAAGGLPVQAHSTDAEHGSGVRVESFHTFISLVDYVLALRKRLTIQPLIDVKHYARLVVIGDEVVSSVEYLSRDKEAYSFRHRDVMMPREFPLPVRQLAVAAAQSHKLSCAAVNILISRTEEAFVEEAVFPFHFGPDQDVTGVNIAERMLDHLLAECAQTHASA